MRLLLVPICLLMLATSCHKNRSDKPITCSDGLLFWGGDPAADGIGWYYAVSRASQNRYYLEAVPDAYKTDSLAVHICLAPTDKAILCNCVGTPPTYHAIKEIRKR